MKTLKEYLQEKETIVAELSAIKALDMSYSSTAQSYCDDLELRLEQIEDKISQLN